MTLFRRLLALSCLALATPVAAQSIDTPAGKLKGTTSGAITAYKGIPYALPPVGGRRWQPPVPAPKWNDVRDAGAFGPACIQPTSKVQTVYSPTVPLKNSEDCSNFARNRAP